MKVVYILGIIVLIQLVASEVTNKEEKKHEHGSKKSLHPEYNDKKLHRQQKNFRKYLKDWKEFSESGKSWQVKVKKDKGHDERNPKYKLNFHKEKKTDEKLIHLEKNTNELGKKEHTENANRLNIKNRYHRRRVFRPLHNRSDRREMRERWNKRRLQRLSKDGTLPDMKDHFRRGQKDMKDHFRRGHHQEIRNRYELLRERKEHMMKLRKEGFNDVKKEDKKGLDKMKHASDPAEKFHSLHRQFNRQNHRTLGPESMFCKRHADRKCPDMKREVCGSNGITYQNRCLLMKDICKNENKELDIKMTKRGACK